MRLLLGSHLALFAAIPGASFVAFLWSAYTVAANPTVIKYTEAETSLGGGHLLVTYVPYWYDRVAYQALQDEYSQIGTFIFIGCALILNYLLIRWAEQS